jgi:hypothetical protein
MWCCWISPGHNPASTQRRGRRAPEYRAARVCSAEAQASIRLMASTWPSIRRRRCRVVLNSIPIPSRARSRAIGAALRRKHGYAAFCSLLRPSGRGILVEMLIQED